MATSLSKRIRADTPRFLEDVLRSLKDYSAEIDDILQLQKQFIRQTAAGFVLEINLNGPKNSPAVKPGAGAVKVADLEGLRKNYRVIDELWATRESLEEMAVNIRQSFAKRGGETERAIAEIAKLQKRVDRGLEEAFIFVSSLAHKNLPVKFAAFNDALCEILASSIAYQDSKQFVYLSEVDGDLVFSNYIQLLKVQDEDGTYYPEMYFVSSYRLGPAATETFVAVLPKFSPPSERLLIRKVTTVKETARALQMLLSLDNFSTSMGSLPVALMLNRGVDRDLFLYQTMIKSIEVREEQVLFTLKSEVTDKAVADKIISQIFLDFKQIIKKTGAKVRMAVKRAEKCFVLTFFFVPDRDSLAATEEDLQFLKDRFQLNDATLRSVVKTINTGLR